MGSEKETKSPATPVVAKQPANVGRPPIDALALSLSDKQFEKLQKTLLYGMAVFGFLAGGKRPTPTKANLAELKSYADAVLELVG